VGRGADGGTKLQATTRLRSGPTYYGQSDGDLGYITTVADIGELPQLDNLEELTIALADDTPANRQAVEDRYPDSREIFMTSPDPSQS
jgi:hypothetical protein